MGVGAATNMVSPWRKATSGPPMALVIDDHPENTESVIASVGYSVAVATEADEALAMLDAYSTELHVVLLDLFLPGVEKHGGPVGFASKVRRVYWGRLIVSSGHDLIAREVAEENVATCLLKPYSVDTLVDLLR